MNMPINQRAQLNFLSSQSTAQSTNADTWRWTILLNLLIEIEIFIKNESNIWVTTSQSYSDVNINRKTFRKMNKQFLNWLLMVVDMIHILKNSQKN